MLLALGAVSVPAATIPVGGVCTLVDAITAANTDTATGGCAGGNGADVIMLPAGSMQTLTDVNNRTYSPTGLPVISSTIVIAGNGSTLMRDSGALEFRLFAVSSTGELTLQETTVSGGRVHGGVTGSGEVYYGDDRSGGGVANFGGTLSIRNSTISGNAALADCTVYVCFPGRGGGVYNRSGTLIVTHSTIAGNSSDHGSGVAVYGGTVTVIDSTISGNTGGGVAVGYGTLTVTTSTISGNTGGGIEVDGRGTVTVTTSTISDNTGGGVFNNGTVTVADSTISAITPVMGAACSTPVLLP
jgi:hypothetical protein